MVSTDPILVTVSGQCVYCLYLSFFVNISVGLDSSPQDEFLSLLFGARTSPALHQFLVSSLGEAVSSALTNAIYFLQKLCVIHVFVTLIGSEACFQGC